MKWMEHMGRCLTEFGARDENRPTRGELLAAGFEEAVAAGAGRKGWPE